MYAAGGTSVPSDEEADVKSTGEVVEEEDGCDRSIADGEAEREGVEEEEEEEATPSTSSEGLDDSDASPPRHEPADPFTRHTLTWDADTVERGVELTCQGK